MYERFISSSILTGTLLAAISLIRRLGLSATGGQEQRSCQFPISNFQLPSADLFERCVLGVGNWELGVDKRSDIEILDVERVVFDELAARFDLVAHQRREHQVGLGVVFGLDLKQ